MFKSKKAATFGTIVAVFGTVLIALGFAWLIAQNWHQINKWVKIVILIAVTGASFFSGTFFRIRKHEGIGKSLHALGALFYTLTLFLIAQIFSFEASLQGTAWLLLMSWAGVGFTAYALNSSFNLAISLAEFLGWLVAQFLAFSERFEEFRPGVLAFALLFVAIILFGLYLFHKSKNHLFARAYQFWTAFYILAFTYVLSFQSLLPSMWPKGVLSAPSQIWFPSAFLLLSIIFGILGISSAIRKKVSQTKEIAGFGAIVAILAILIGSTSFTSDIVGNCYTKSCYNYGDEENCTKGAEINQNSRGCAWNGNACIPEGELCMRSSKDREQCLKYAEKGLCRWEMGTCQQDGCWNLNNKSSCQSSPLPCEWKEENEIDQRCVEMNCYQYQISADCESKKDKLNCAWRPNYCSVEDKCQEFQNEYGICNTQPTCQWSTGFNRWEGNPAKFPPILWAVWIIINIAFIGIILAVIGYGTSEHLPKIINLGIIFFALDVITRYVGFIMDLWGYTSLAVIFITGGIILVFGGWGIEKWRRKLVGKTRTSATKE